MNRRRLLAVLCSVLLVAGLASACTSGNAAPEPSSSELNDHTDATFQGLGLTPPQPRPQFTLLDTSGKPYKFGSATAGRPTLLYFGYTNCPDVCPLTMANIATALRAEPAELRAKTDVVFVTTDIKHDTGPVLKSYLAHFDADLPNKFIGLYGTQNQIDAAQSASHVVLAQDDGQTHSSQVLLYGPDDYARVSFLQSNNQSEAMQHDLALVAQA
ncbi:MAG: senC [Frankiales bacterium]|nr:senC [Frankiales bacterium]